MKKRNAKDKGLPEGRPFVNQDREAYWLMGVTTGVPEAVSLVSFSAK
jgi:hypothetical protein